MHAAEELRLVDPVELPEEAHLRDEARCPTRRASGSRPCAARSPRASGRGGGAPAGSCSITALKRSTGSSEIRWRSSFQSLVRRAVLVHEPGLRVGERDRRDRSRAPSRGPRAARARRSRRPAPSGSTSTGRARSSGCSCRPSRGWSGCGGTRCAGPSRPTRGRSRRVRSVEALSQIRIRKSVKVCARSVSIDLSDEALARCRRAARR